MAKKMDICLICLRTDKRLKVFDRRLADFHDELCGFNVDIPIPQYCPECEYLLTKLYNFKKKCIKAIKILNNWRKTKADAKESLTLLYTHLPSTLEELSSETGKVCQHQNDSGRINRLLMVEPLSDITIPGAEEVKGSLPHEDIKLEIDNGTDYKALHLEEFLALKTEDTNIDSVLLKNDENGKKDEDFGNSIDSNLDKDFDSLSFSSDDSIILSLTKNKNERKTKRKSTTTKHEKCIKCDQITDNKQSPTQINIHENTSKRKKSVKERKIDDKDVSKRKRVRKKKINEEDSSKRRRFHTNKDIIAELSNISLNDDENCEKTPKGQNKPDVRERLKCELKKKFSLCDELKADDGTVIDKDFILSSIDDKITDYVLKQLSKAVTRKKSFSPRALKLFKAIQHKYKNNYEHCFDIEFLNSKEKMLQEFEDRKTYEAYVKAEYKCELCYQGFKHEKKLEYHMKAHDESAGEFMCSICKIRLKSKKGLIGHIRSHEAVYKCKLCPLVTHYQCSMINHSQLHNGVIFRCEPCDATFKSVSSYRSHRSYRHRRRHVCTACGRAFLTSTGLKGHATRVHRGEAPSTDATVTCHQCDLTFPSAEVYRRHVRVSHETRVRGRRPGSTGQYGSDKPRKTPVITCRLCNAVGSSVGWLSLHFRTDHPSADLETVYADKKTNLCEVCGKGFTTIYTLRAHLLTHAATRLFACGACGARFHRACSLRAHRGVHAPPARACTHCGKKFRSQSNLTNHIRFHIGDRRYKCKICSKGFLHRSTLNEHVRGVHHNVRRVRKRGTTSDNTREPVSSAKND